LDNFAKPQAVDVCCLAGKWFVRFAQSWMILMAIRFLYFDLGNVLLNFSHRQACEQMGAVSGVSADMVWKVVFESKLEHRFESGEIKDEQFYEEFCAGVGSKPDYDALLRAGSEIFSVNAPILPLVAQLRAGGHRMGILSNTCRPHWNYCVHRNYGVVRQMFSTFALSYEIGACKPSPKIFLAAAALARVEPNEIFFTDDIPSHIEGAREAGFDAVLYTSVPALAAALRERGILCNY
jgi:glucose-1-phosphatase